jgi:hypothetical protein
MFVRFGAAICGAMIFIGCSFAAMAEAGIASVYAYAGQRTASGERAQPNGLTAAHRTLPFGTRVRAPQIATPKGTNILQTSRLSLAMHGLIGRGRAF